MWRPADDFVRDFVGSDRVLKALGLVAVRSVMDTSVPRVSAELSGEALRAAVESLGTDVAFVVDDNGRPQGCVQLAQSRTVSDRSVPQEVRPWDSNTMSVPATATVRDVLSVMILNGLRDLAVVDETGILKGWVPRTKLFSLLEDINTQGVAS